MCVEITQQNKAEFGKKIQSDYFIQITMKVFGW